MVEILVLGSDRHRQHQRLLTVETWPSTGAHRRSEASLSMVQQAAASTAVGSDDRVIFWMSDVQHPPVQGGVLCTIPPVRDSGPR